MEARQRRFWLVAIAVIVVLALLSAAWRYTPLSELITPDRIRAWAKATRASPWAPIALIAAYTPAAFLMFPRPVLTLFAAIAFGPVLGFTYALAGIAISSIVAFHVGRSIPAETLDRLVRGKMDRFRKTVRRHGIVSVLTLRVLPTAPFVVESMACGALRIRLWDYIVGTAFGMTPGVFMTAFFGHQVAAALEDRSSLNYWLIGGVVAVFAVMMYAARRFLSSRASEE
jgi:uncharacterized membrane protein YdjX (TVP38/TMEM64 family)